MNYPFTAIPENRVPHATNPLFHHLIATYASESNKTASVWRCFMDAHLEWKPDPKSMTVLAVFRHQLLSERRFFADLGAPEPAADSLIPPGNSVESFIARFTELASGRLDWLAARTEQDWLTTVPFFDVERQRIWVFWRRVLHSAHHRTQLAVYLRLLALPVPPIYGPTADVTWSAADPTHTADAAGRRTS